MGALAIADPDAGDCRNPAPRRAERPAAASWRDVAVPLGAFALESGERLDDPVLRLRLHGADGLPVVIAAGGISAGRKVVDAGDEPGWWRALAGPGAAVDTNAFQLVGFDFLPGEERTEKTITPADQARALALALDALGVETVSGFIGASYGGFVGLSFAALFPARIARLCVISAAARSDPMTTALRGVQRRIIAFAREAGREAEGVALARELAMTTYRSADEFRARFDGAPLGPRVGDPFDVCAYLAARGRAYAEKMPAARYLTLSDSLDRARVDPAAIRAECLFIAAKSDRLVPAADTEATAREVFGPSDFLLIDSLVGHDAFLCDTPLFADQVKRFLHEGVHDRVA